MAAPGVVVDTSALIDAADANHPEWGEVLTRLLGERGATAPELIASEAGNVVHHKHPAAFGDTPGERAVVLEVLLDGVARTHSSEDSRARCATLVEETGLTFYDAQFLELAERRGAVLLTQDEKLVRAGKRLLGDARSLTLDEAARAAARGEL